MRASRRFARKDVGTETCCNGSATAIAFRGLPPKKPWILLGWTGMTRPRYRPAFASPRARARVAQLVEHATENRSVGGSTPSPGTIFLYCLRNYPNARKPSGFKLALGLKRSPANGRRAFIWYSQPHSWRASRTLAVSVGPVLAGSSLDVPACRRFHRVRRGSTNKGVLYLSTRLFHALEALP